MVMLSHHVSVTVINELFVENLRWKKLVNLVSNEQVVKQEIDYFADSWNVRCVPNEQVLDFGWAICVAVLVTVVAKHSLLPWVLHIRKWVLRYLHWYYYLATMELAEEAMPHLKFEKCLLII